MSLGMETDMVVRRRRKVLDFSLLSGKNSNTGPGGLEEIMQDERLEFYRTHRDYVRGMPAGVLRFCGNPLLFLSRNGRPCLFCRHVDRAGVGTFYRVIDGVWREIAGPGREAGSLSFPLETAPVLGSLAN